MYGTVRYDTNTIGNIYFKILRWIIIVFDDWCSLVGLLFLSEQFGILVKYERCSRQAGRKMENHFLYFVPRIVRTKKIYKMESYSRAFEEYTT